MSRYKSLRVAEGLYIYYRVQTPKSSPDSKKLPKKKGEAVSFQPFNFDGNQAWGFIDSMDEWRRIVKAYATWDVQTLMKRAQATIKSQHEPVPSFGLRYEHRAELTLEAWAKQHNVYDLLVGVHQSST